MPSSSRINALKLLNYLKRLCTPSFRPSEIFTRTKRHTVERPHSEWKHKNVQTIQNSEDKNKPAQLKRAFLSRSFSLYFSHRVLFQEPLGFLDFFHRLLKLWKILVKFLVHFGKVAVDLLNISRTESPTCPGPAPSFGSGPKLCRSPPSYIWKSFFQDFLEFPEVSVVDVEPSCGILRQGGRDSASLEQCGHSFTR